MSSAWSSGQDERRLAYALRARSLDGDERALPDLRQATQAVHPEVRAAAAWGLGYFEADDTVDLLLDLLDDPDAHVRAAAESSLVRKGSAVMQRVQAFAITASDPARQMAIRVLRRLASKVSHGAASLPAPPSVGSAGLTELGLLVAVHDIRGLSMAAGLLLAEASADEGLSPGARERIQRVEAGFGMMQVILRGLLDERAAKREVSHKGEWPGSAGSEDEWARFSRARNPQDSDRQCPSPNPSRPGMLALNAAVNEAVELSRPITDVYEMEVRLSVAEPGPVVQAEGSDIVRAVLNLVWNACKHGLDTGVVSVVVGRSDVEAWVEVGDNGPGIPVDRQRSLTEAFARGDGQREDGWGLGLFLVSQVSCRYGGRVLIDSALGAGTRIRLCLPLG